MELFSTLLKKNTPNARFPLYHPNFHISHTGLRLIPRRTSAFPEIRYLWDLEDNFEYT